MDNNDITLHVNDVLTDSQLCHIVKKCVGEVSWQLLSCELRPAAEGLTGFGGHHFRMTLRLRAENELLNFPLFMKTMPLHNKSRKKFIEENQLFTREMTLLNLMENIGTAANPWAPETIFCNETVLVLPDLAASVRNKLETFDIPHELIALASLARFHAAIANYETRQSRALHRSYSLMEDHGEIIVESVFQDMLWLNNGAKLTTNIIQNWSKYKDLVPNLEASVLRQFQSGLNDLTKSKDSLNVVLHRDLWANNIMFKYNNGIPDNAMLIDFQCVRYGPPAFDVMMLLYLTTTRSFRLQHKDTVLRQYLKLFLKSLDMDTKLRLKDFGYDYEEFLRRTEIAQRFSIVAGLMMFPAILMDPVTAAAVYDDPEMMTKLMNIDSTPVVFEYAKRFPEYGRRQLELTEEFVEMYLHREKGTPGGGDSPGCEQSASSDESEQSSDSGCSDEDAPRRQPRPQAPPDRASRRTRVTGRQWVMSLSARSNQDGQRRFEERAGRQMRTALARRGNTTPGKLKAPPGGVYAKLEAEWRERHGTRPRPAVSARVRLPPRYK